MRAAARRIAESLRMVRAAKSWAADLFEIVSNSAVGGLVASPGAVLALLHHGAAPAGGRGPGRQKEIRRGREARNAARGVSSRGGVMIPRHRSDSAHLAWGPSALVRA